MYMYCTCIYYLGASTCECVWVTECTNYPGQRFDTILLSSCLSQQYESCCSVVESAGIGSSDGAPVRVRLEGRLQAGKLCEIGSGKRTSTYMYVCIYSAEREVPVSTHDQYKHARSGILHTTSFVYCKEAGLFSEICTLLYLLNSSSCFTTMSGFPFFWGTLTGTISLPRVPSSVALWEFSYDLKRQN